MSTPADRLDEARAEEALAELDAKHHDQLPYGTNCSLCGYDHPAIWPSAICEVCDGTYEDHVDGYIKHHSFRDLPIGERPGF